MEQAELPAVVEHETNLAKEKAAHEAEIERQQVEAVFGLTGGELYKKPWEPYADKELTDKLVFAYSYDGSPYYDERHDDYENTYATVVSCCLYGSEPDELFEKGARWTKVQEWRSSGETECWCGQDEKRRLIARMSADERVILGLEIERCPYCEDDGSSDSPHIYIGDGWHETVYQKTEICEVCFTDLVTNNYVEATCLSCQPYDFEVRAEGAENYGGTSVVYKGSDPEEAELEFSQWAKRCDVEMLLDGEIFKEDSAYTREKKAIERGMAILRRAESYGGSPDWKSFYAECGTIRKPWDDFSAAFATVRTHAGSMRQFCIEVRRYLDGKLLKGNRFPMVFEDGTTAPADAYKRVVGVYFWERTGKIESWSIPSEPGTYPLPDGRTFTVESK